MRVLALTGAGISVESGLGTFRDVSGLWERFDPMKLATPKGFARDPDAVHAFYNARRRNLMQAQPNAAHTALAVLEERLTAAGGELFLVTQNVDDLHEQGGSRRVVHMHGELFRVRCLACGTTTDWRNDVGSGDRCLSCNQPGKLRPDIVWFGEVPLHMATIGEALLEADLFVAIGTSGSVYPAAGFVREARDHGVRTCELNLEPSDNAQAFDEHRYGPASVVVPAWVEHLTPAIQAPSDRAT